MLSLIVSSASYNAALRSTAPVVQRAAAPTMKKSEALPFMEEPAHLAGMIGNVGFDPLSLSTPQNIKWMREAELKHGRMTMLAWTGYVAVDLGLKLPGAKYAALTSYTAHQVCVCPRAVLSLPQSLTPPSLVPGHRRLRALLPAAARRNRRDDRLQADLRHDGRRRPRRRRLRL